MTTQPQTGTILIVDDDADCREIAGLMLTRAGYTVRTVESGAECLAIARTEPVDLILLDVMMPGMDGLQVCMALREADLRIPVILLTAKDDVDTRLEGMHLGVCEFLRKPINRMELIARVRAQLHILELGRQLETVERSLHALRREPPPPPKPEQ